MIFFTHSIISVAWSHLLWEHVMLAFVKGRQPCLMVTLFFVTDPFARLCMFLLYHVQDLLTTVLFCSFLFCLVLFSHFVHIFFLVVYKCCPALGQKLKLWWIALVFYSAGNLQSPFHWSPSPAGSIWRSSLGKLLHHRSTKHDGMGIPCGIYKWCRHHTPDLDTTECDYMDCRRENTVLHNFWFREFVYEQSQHHHIQWVEVMVPNL